MVLGRFYGFRGSWLVFHFHVENILKLCFGPTIQSRPCRPKASFGLVEQKVSCRNWACVLSSSFLWIWALYLIISVNPVNILILWRLWPGESVNKVVDRIRYKVVTAGPFSWQPLMQSFQFPTNTTQYVDICLILRHFLFALDYFWLLLVLKIRLVRKLLRGTSNQDLSLLIVNCSKGWWIHLLHQLLWTENQWYVREN